MFAGACVTGTEVELPELAGLWDVEEAVYIGVLDPALTGNLSERGVSATMDIAADGAFNMVITGGMVDGLTGQLAVDGNELEITIDGAVFPGEVFIEDDRAVLRILGGVTFDFDEDGDEEAARSSSMNTSPGKTAGSCPRMELPISTCFHQTVDQWA